MGLPHHTSCKACGRDVCHNLKCKNPIIYRRKRMVLCVKCQDLQYCSDACRIEHWETQHGQECLVSWEEECFFDSFNTKPCPVTARFGCHRHRERDMTKQQQETLQSVLDTLALLPLNHPRYILSCQCEQFVTKALIPHVTICIDSLKSKDYLLVYARCKKETCSLRSAHYDPLLVLYRVSTVSSQVYVAMAYWDCRQETSTDTRTTFEPVVINGNSKALVSLPPNYSLHCIRAEAKHYVTTFKQFYFFLFAKNEKKPHQLDYYLGMHADEWKRATPPIKL